MRFSTTDTISSADYYADNACWLALVARLLPGGRVSRTGEYTGVVNPLRDDRNAGSVFVHVATRKFIDSAAPDTFSVAGPYKLVASLFKLSPFTDDRKIDSVLSFLSWRRLPRPFTRE